MGTKTVSLQIRSNRTLEEVKLTARDTFRILGGVIQERPYGFDIDGGNVGVNFGFTASVRAAVSVTGQAPGLFQISSVIVWSPNSLVWICLAAGWLFLGLLWIIPALYLFVDPAPVYSRATADVERALNLIQSPAQKLPDAPAAPAGQDVTQALKKLQEMHAAGLITSQEYEAKKAEILARF